MLDIELHELLVAAQRRCRDKEAPERLISRSRIELVIALVSQEARPDSTKPDWLRVALDLLERQPLTIRAGRRARKIEYADALEVVAEIHDEIERVALLELEVHRVAIGAKTLLQVYGRKAK